jgi:hypothetical protein
VFDSWYLFEKKAFFIPISTKEMQTKKADKTMTAKMYRD